MKLYLLTKFEQNNQKKKGVDQQMLTNMIRTLFLYLLLITVMRILGKKQVGQLDPTEFVVVLLLSELAAVSMQDMNLPLMNCIVPIVTLLCIEIIFSVLEMKSKRLRDLMQGSPVIIISDGKLLYKSLKATRYNIDDVMQELRIAGYSDIREIQFAILENSGNLSVIPKAANRPLTAEDINISVKPEGYPHIVISDGKINEQALESCGLEKKRLMKKLGKDGILSPENIFFAIYDTCGNFYYQLKV